MQTTAEEQLVGKTLGNYHLERQLGHGKLSAVYQARHPAYDSTVMVTTFLLPEAFSAQARARFSTRFTTISSKLVKLQHPHVLSTYDFGEQAGYPYLVTPFVKGTSLTKTRKQHGQYSAEDAVTLIKQVAAALDYAHHEGVTHGTLSTANILVSNEGTVQVAGFGLLHILEMRGILPGEQPYAHLFSIAGTFLGTAEYISPEFIQGASADARSDVYALGVILFELLTGTPPFTSSNPLEAAIQQAVPTLATLRPDVPAGFDLVVQRALERNPAQRYQSAGELVAAFERVSAVLKGATRPSGILKQDTQTTMPPTVDWYSEELVTGKQASVLSTPTGSMPVADGSSSTAKTSAIGSVEKSGNWQFKPPIVTSKMTAIPNQLQSGQTSRAEAQPAHEDDGAIDPFVWWTTSTLTNADGQTPGTFLRSAPARTRSLKRRQSPDKQRRQVVAMVATGLVVGGISIGGGIKLAQFLQHHMHPEIASVPTTSPSMKPATPNTQGVTGQAQKTPTRSAAPTSVSKPTATPSQTVQATPTAQSTTTTQPTATTQPTPTPTTQPTPTPTPQPQHTGTVIGSTSQGTNTAKDFTNPADGNSSTLVHLPSGSFVAYEKACPHEGVAVYYDSGSQHLICPRHNAIFDPANGARVLQGPADRPLTSVSIKVNADGTITTG